MQAKLPSLKVCNLSFHTTRFEAFAWNCRNAFHNTVCLFAAFCILNVASRFIEFLLASPCPCPCPSPCPLHLQLCTCNSGCKKRLHFADNRGIKWAASATTSTSKYTQTQVNECSSAMHSCIPASLHPCSWRRIRSCIRIKNSIRRTVHTNPANEYYKYVLSVPAALRYPHRRRGAYALGSWICAEWQLLKRLKDLRNYLGIYIIYIFN